MFVRVFLALGFVAASSSAALAVNEYHLLAMQLDANTRAIEEAGLAQQLTGSPDQFSMRSSWIDLRLPRGAAIRSVGSRLITARTASTVRMPKLTTTRSVGGLGRQLSGGEASFSFGSISSGAGSSAAAPRFSSLHEGSGSYSFSFNP